MPKVPANDIEIEYEAFGSISDPPVLLVMGLGAQMTAWDSAFCQLIADKGFFVIRFDNRDVGLSTWLDHLDIHPLADILAGTIAAPYTLVDMAHDAAGLLDALGVESAHVVGASMGGMIAQTFVLEHPHRVLSLTSIMSTTGDGAVGRSTPDALAALTGPAPRTRDEAIDRGVATSKVIGSTGFDFDEQRVRDRAAYDFDRAFHPAGMARQIAAIVSQPDRTSALGAVTVPVLVIHGADDPLVTLSGGEATAAAIPGAQLKIVPGMGHDLPPALHAHIADALTEHFSRV